LAQNNNNKKEVHGGLGGKRGLTRESQEDIQRDERESYFVDKALLLSYTTHGAYGYVFSRDHLWS
jgi:hypothetical protein